LIIRVLSRASGFAQSYLQTGEAQFQDLDFIDPERP
jgi:hypothetical protein